MNNVGEQHRHLLVLRRSADLCDRCTTLVTELGVRWQFGAARPTRQSRRCQRTVTTVIHVSIVSLLLGDVRQIKRVVAYSPCQDVNHDGRTGAWQSGD